MSKKPAKEKNIVLLSDGTGNSAAKVWKTNVWRLYKALNLADATQVAFYDDGVGTSSFKPLAALGGALGYALHPRAAAHDPAGPVRASTCM